MFSLMIFVPNNYETTQTKTQSNSLKTKIFAKNLHTKTIYFGLSRSDFSAHSFFKKLKKLSSFFIIAVHPI